MIERRAYQQDLMDCTRTAMSLGCRTPLIVAPTGSGKGTLAAMMLAEAARRGIPSWFINHRRELLRQSSAKLREVGLEHGIVAADQREHPERLVQVCAVQTLARRLRRLRPPRMIVWDEVHHLPAKSWAAIYRAVPNAYHIGLSASPQRLDGAGLREFFAEMIVGPSVAELIAQGYLAPFKLYAPSRPDLTGVRSRMGDYANTELSERMDKPSITGNAVQHYTKLAPGKRALVRAVSIVHSRHIAGEFNAAGIKAEHVDGNTPEPERDAIFARFAAGETTILCQVEIAGEGLDIPGIECAIDLRPTQSLTMALQFWGRALRPAPGKVAILIDHAGNCFSHGMPDEDRQWSLDGQPRSSRRAQGVEAVRTCGKCFAAAKLSDIGCPYCGTAFEPSPREVKQIDGELEQVMRIEKKREQGRAQSFDALVELGRQRGYRNAGYWASKVWNSRHG